MPAGLLLPPSATMRFGAESAFQKFDQLGLFGRNDFAIIGLLLDGADQVDRPRDREIFARILKKM
jgi:hypothetical protein